MDRIARPQPLPRTRRFDLSNAHAPGQDVLIAVCPHCWEVNVRAQRLCGRCGADMHLALQESGGLRATSPVQSPVPVRVRARLTPLQRALVLCFVALLVIGQVLTAIYWSARRAGAAGAAATGPTPSTPASTPSRN